MLIFDIDSLIMLNVSDSKMSESLSISNIRLYQSIRQICATATVRDKQNDIDVNKFIYKMLLIGFFSFVYLDRFEC
jgi:hypothetical protein